ncbi:hypothetical protein AT15_09830 [Kosmotoga arenicorallina S304]|uniref:Uncharacterized protein n=1 Tax=Kosmotoga arenicorallina S304 TaxID=1453497 RepID=A0A176K119_9BACT|nr:hypothetical protein [Kosmotoga arenicorallina]OAA30715.1 hypothetical protein AT15_09830 [Kosmotoga arenicorallina S304]
MKKFVLLFALLLTLLLLTSCFKVSYAVLTLFMNPVGDIHDGTEVTFTWQLNSQDEVISANYTLHIGDLEVPLGSETSYATTLGTGDYEVWVTANFQTRTGVFNLGPASTESNHQSFRVYSSGINFLNAENEYASDEVIIEWEPVDGLTHSYIYSLDGGPEVETAACSATLSDLSDGWHTLAVKIAESGQLPATFNFRVDTTGPSPMIYGSDRTAAALADGDIRPFGRYAYIGWQFNEPVSAVEIRFRDAEDLSTWLTDWIPWDPTVSGMLVNDELVTLYTPDGISYLDHLFEIGHSYLIYVSGYDELGNWGYSYMTFRFDERYGNTDKPEVYYLPFSITPASTDASGTMEIYVVAPNVRDYAAEDIHNYYGPDTSYDADLMYIQTTLLFDEGLEVEDVIFPDFIDDKKDLSGYVADVGELTLCRGFVNGEDEDEEQSDILAVITLKFGVDMNGTNPVIAIDDNYIIRDSNNRVIDGIVVDNFGYYVTIPAPEAAGM